MASSRTTWKLGGFRWELAEPWAGAAEAARQLKTSPLIAQVLHNRGMADLQEMRRFLSPKLTDLHPPELLPGLEQAADRLARAARDGEKVCIYGDYDVDGMTAVAILLRCLAMHGAVVDYYVPHRLEEGYGVNAEAVRRIAAGGATLLVTVDCGVSACEPLREARALGMDVVVTDHHAPGPSLPEVLAVVHPALPGGGYPSPELSGAGVAFKLAWQVARLLSARAGSAERLDEPMRRFLLEATSLAALGVIADVVPLVGENRVLATYGLQGLAATEHAGIRALLSSAGLVGEKLSARHVGFALAPRLNACGRMGHARLAVELLARADADRCRRIAEHLERQNTRRQQIERQILDQAMAMVAEGRAGAPGDAAIVLASPDWHAGVVGIVASRLMERFGRPVVLIALNGEQAQGSARSIAGFHMRDALAACGEHLDSFGGHAMAGGLRLPARAVGDFAGAFAAYAAEKVSPEMLVPALSVDAQVTLWDLGYPVVEHLERLAPFGQGNRRPLVAVRGVSLLQQPRRMGRSGAAVSFVVGQQRDGDGAPTRGARMRCVGFGMGELADQLVGINTLDVVGSPVLNHFAGRTSVEMRLRDVRRGA